MRKAAAAAWPAFCASYEGRCSWLYLDTKRLPTTGLGHRVFDLDDMLELPWLTKTDEHATSIQIADEWHRIAKRTDLAPKGGFAFRTAATLHLADSTVDLLFERDTPAYWDPLVKVLPKLESWPADAQLALLDMSYNLGAYFLGSKWPNFTAACKATDFLGAATHCLRAGPSSRDYRHRRLFTNAATVVRTGADPDRLWDAATPSKSAPPVTPPVVVPPVVVTPPPLSTPGPEPEETPVALSQTKRVEWKNSGHYVDERTHAQLEAVELLLGYPIVMYQGSWSNGSLSADTHAGAGAADVGPPSRALETACRKVGLAAWWRHTGSWADNRHVHALSIGNSHLASWAKVQEAAYKAGYDGLGPKARSGKDSGSRAYTGVVWEDVQEEFDMPTAKDIATEVMKEIRADDVLMAEIATAVLTADLVPNQFTSNAANPTVSMLTALDRIGRKLNAISAAVLPAGTPVSDPDKVTP